MSNQIHMDEYWSDGDALERRMNEFLKNLAPKQSMYTHTWIVEFLDFTFALRRNKIEIERVSSLMQHPPRIRIIK